MSTTTIETARTKVFNLLDGLKAIMAAGYYPTFDYAYNHHIVANLQIPAATVEIDPVENTVPLGDEVASACFIGELTATVRVHTGYADHPLNELTNLRLLNSIENYVNENRNLGDNYRIKNTHGLDPAVEYPDSGTVGGELKITIRHLEEVSQL